MSNIITISIDGTYPTAGQDNNSQGFRDNFSNIKTALTVAKGEIDALETSAARKNVDNDFNGVLIENAEVRRLYGSVDGLGTRYASFSIDTRDADFFHTVIGAPLTITFGNWPIDDLYRKITLRIRSDGVSRQVDFATTGGGIIKKSGFPASPFITGTDPTVDFLIEASTLDGGDIVYLKFVGSFI